MVQKTGEEAEGLRRYLDKVHHGDTLPYLKRLPDSCVDVMVSSPPYNVGRGKERRKELSKYLEFQTEVLRECHRLLRPTGSFFWQVGAYVDAGTHYPLDILFFPILESFGMRPRNRIIWPRAHGLHARQRFSCRHEAILWFTKGDEYKFFLDRVRVPQRYPNKKAWTGPNKGKLTCNPEGKNPGDVWLFENVKHNHEEQTIHPAQFPEALIGRIVLGVTEPGDVVLDPYMGSGTVAVVAQELGRHFLGAELEADYHEVCERRLSGQPTENGRFANLKQLRAYGQRHRLRELNGLSFDAQTAKVPCHGKTDLEKTLQHKETLWCLLSEFYGQPEQAEFDFIPK